MYLFIAFILITGVSIFLAIKRQKPIFLSLPVVSLITIAVVEVALFPAPFLDTVKFIFSLR